jgi:hypothetical protein
MSAPTEERFGDFQPEAEPFGFDPTAEGAAEKALAIRRAIDDLPLHDSHHISPVIISEARVTTEEAVEASFISHIPDATTTVSAHIKTEAARPPEDPDATGGFAAWADPAARTQLLLPKKIFDEMRLGEASPEASKWTPTKPEVVEHAKERIEFDEVAATVAKIALEEVAKQNIASIGDERKVDEVMRARETLKELFHEDVAILPPKQPQKPEVISVMKQAPARQRFGRLAVLPLVLLQHLRQR